MGLLEVLAPFLLADVLNPVLFGFMVYAAGTQSPIASTTAAVAGHTLAYFFAGILLAPGIEGLSARLKTPFPIDYIIGFVLGILLTWAAIAASKKKKGNKTASYTGLSPLKAFGMGAIINFIGIPFALPYFAALGQILKADLSFTHSVLVLLGYNLAYALPFMIVPVLVVTRGEAGQPLLNQINGWVKRIATYLMPVMLWGLSLAMVADALFFFFTHQGLF